MENPQHSSADDVWDIGVLYIRFINRLAVTLWYYFAKFFLSAILLVDGFQMSNTGLTCRNVHCRHIASQYRISCQEREGNGGGDVRPE